MSTIGKRRALGQHFLRDPGVIRKIVETGLALAQENHCSTVLEIGPGKGAISLPMIEQLSLSSTGVRQLIVCEMDRALVELWKTKAGELPPPGGTRPTITVVEGDFLEATPQSWLGEGPLAVISNLPYSAGTAIVTRLARMPEKIPVMVLMFQAEVAKRLRAEPRTKDWGSLSVWIQNQWEVKKLITVPPGAFKPPPRVESEVVILTPRREPRVKGTSSPEGNELWERLLKLCFAHRRKMLRSGLPESGPWRKALESAGIVGTRRAEELQWNEWDAFFQAVAAAEAETESEWPC
jgi:16S rRNA (adenine1518-N6/adenine1519-N6)-dimethyltransferase